MFSISIAHPLPLFFCPIILGIVIVCNAKGQPKEWDGCDFPCRLENSPEHSHRKERIKVIIVPPALSPPHGAFPCCKDEEEEEEGRCYGYHCGHIRQHIDCTRKKKAAKPINLCVMPTWVKPTASWQSPTGRSGFLAMPQP